MEAKIKWLGHATIMIEKQGKRIYADPWKIKNPLAADLVLVTHSHYDHCSPEDISGLLGRETTVAGPPDALEKIEGGIKKPLLPGEVLEMEWVKVEGVRSYNKTKPFHPRENNWLGFLLRFQDTSIYIAGDTDLIPEMETVKADTVILPVGGTYTMDAKQAAAAVNLIAPKVAIPIHFGDIVGSGKDAENFASLVKKGEVKILEPSG